LSSPDQSAQADRHTANIAPIVREIQAAGGKTLREIADALNACGFRTARRGGWYASTVRNLLARPGSVSGLVIC
jgi:hypothetical protein